MRKFLTILSICSSTLIVQAFGQFQDKDVNRYIETYKDLAIQEQVNNKIPAAIKLAQGIYETAAGTSELANNAKNHFGIKCKSSWQGQSYTYDDDRKGECFRMYNQHAESYLDHSQFLKTNKRYAPLFELSILDYKGWAKQLKSCGYATNPAYAEKIIDIIERYQLYKYTELALYANNQTDAMIASVGDQPIFASYNAANSTSNSNAHYQSKASPLDDGVSDKDYYRELKLHGIKGFYAKKGDMLLQHAIKYKVRYPTLLMYNDLKDEPLPYDMFIYLDNKKKTGDRPHVIVGKTQNLHSISQAEGIQLEQLRSLNKLELGDEPAIGAIVQLQTPASTKPNLRVMALENVTLNDNDNANDYISKNEIVKTNKTDDGVVKIIDEDVLPKTIQKEEILDEADLYVEGIDPNDDEVEEEEEEIVIVEKPTKTQTNFRVVDPKTESNTKTDAKPANTKTADNPTKGSKIAENSEIENLKRKMDRSVYSDGDALPIKKTDFDEGVAIVDNNAAGTKYENKVPPPNSELNRSAKQNVPNTSKKNVDKDPNIAFKEHMKMVKTGMFPAYFPKMTGVSHTSNYVAPVAAPTPKRAAPVKEKANSNKKNKKEVKEKPNAKNTKNVKATPKNTKAKSTTANKKTNAKPAAKTKAKAAAPKTTKPPVKKKK